MRYSISQSYYFKVSTCCRRSCRKSYPGIKKIQQADRQTPVPLHNTSHFFKRPYQIQKRHAKLVLCIYNNSTDSQQRVNFCLIRSDCTFLMQFKNIYNEILQTCLLTMVLARMHAAYLCTTPRISEMFKNDFFFQYICILFSVGCTVL